MERLEKIKSLLETLTGQEPPFDYCLSTKIPGDFMDDGLGYSQLNELLLLLGFDRISSSFFQYLYNCSKDKECCFEEYKHGAAFSSLDELEKGILSFKKTALLIYGNVKFAFKTISTNNEILQSTVETITPIEETAFINRHCPTAVPVTDIKKA